MSQSPSEPGSWGHEYIRHLAAELSSEYTIRTEADQDTSELIGLGLVCATFLIEHNAEADAVDLLEELEHVEKIVDLVNKDTFTRVCAYMLRYVFF